jgi:hypothetical protein
MRRFFYWVVLFLSLSFTLCIFPSWQISSPNSAEPIQSGAQNCFIEPSQLLNTISESIEDFPYQQHYSFNTNYTTIGILSINSDTELEYFVGLYGWTGTGESGNPFVVEHYNITGTSAQNLVSISNTKKWIEIRENLFEAGKNSLYLMNVTNIRIINNYFHGQAESGINGGYVNSFKIEQNFFEAINKSAIDLRNGFNIQIIDNLIQFCGEWSIFLSDLGTQTNWIHNNSILYGNNTGIHVQYSNHAQITYNNLIGNRYGINAYYIQNCSFLNNTLFMSKLINITGSDSRVESNNFLNYNGSYTPGDPSCVWRFNYWGDRIGGEDTDHDGIYDHSYAYRFENDSRFAIDNFPRVTMYPNARFHLLSTPYLNITTTFTGFLTDPIFIWNSPQDSFGYPVINQTIYFLEPTEQIWKILSTNLTLNQLNWDSTKIPDGYYYFAVEWINSNGNKSTYIHPQCMINHWHLPEISILSINKGKWLNPFDQIEWTGVVDPYNDSIIYSFEFSWDNGQTWESFTETSISTKINKIPISSTEKFEIRYSASARIRITATSTHGAFSDAISPSFCIVYQSPAMMYLLSFIIFTITSICLFGFSYTNGHHHMRKICKLSQIDTYEIIPTELKPKQSSLLSIVMGTFFTLLIANSLILLWQLVQLIGSLFDSTIKEQFLGGSIAVIILSLLFLILRVGIILYKNPLNQFINGIDKVEIKRLNFSKRFARHYFFSIVHSNMRSRIYIPKWDVSRLVVILENLEKCIEMIPRLEEIPAGFPLDPRQSPQSWEFRMILVQMYIQHAEQLRKIAPEHLIFKKAIPIYHQNLYQAAGRVDLIQRFYLLGKIYNIVATISDHSHKGEAVSAAILQFKLGLSINYLIFHIKRAENDLKYIELGKKYASNGDPTTAQEERIDSEIEINPHAIISSFSRWVLQIPPQVSASDDFFMQFKKQTHIPEITTIPVLDDFNQYYVQETHESNEKLTEYLHSFQIKEGLQVLYSEQNGPFNPVQGYKLLEGIGDAYTILNHLRLAKKYYEAAAKIHLIFQSYNQPVPSELKREYQRIWDKIMNTEIE